MGVCIVLCPRISSKAAKTDIIHGIRFTMQPEELLNARFTVPFIVTTLQCRVVTPSAMPSAVTPKRCHLQRVLMVQIPCHSHCPCHCQIASISVHYRYQYHQSLMQPLMPAHKILLFLLPLTNATATTHYQCHLAVPFTVHSGCHTTLPFCDFTGPPLKPICHMFWSSFPL